MVATTSAIRSGVTFCFDLSYSITKVTHVLNGRIRPIARPSDCVCPAWRMSNLVLWTPTPTRRHIRVSTVPGIRIGKWPADLAVFKHSTKQRARRQIHIFALKADINNYFGQMPGMRRPLNELSTRSPHALLFSTLSGQFACCAPCASAVKANKVCAKSKWSV